MQRVTEPGKFAGWIAPPDGGINNLGLAYEYVRTELRALERLPAGIAIQVCSDTVMKLN